MYVRTYRKLHIVGDRKAFVGCLNGLQHRARIGQPDAQQTVTVGGYHAPRVHHHRDGRDGKRMALCGGICS